jgi:hypothetical protein
LLNVPARASSGEELGRHGFLTPLDVPYASVFPALERHEIHVERRELPWGG